MRYEMLQFDDLPHALSLGHLPSLTQLPLPPPVVALQLPLVAPRVLRRSLRLQATKNKNSAAAAGTQTTQPTQENTAQGEGQDADSLPRNGAQAGVAVVVPWRVSGSVPVWIESVCAIVPTILLTVMVVMVIASLLVRSVVVARPIEWRARTAAEVGGSSWNRGTRSNGSNSARRVFTRHRGS